MTSAQTISSLLVEIYGETLGRMAAERVAALIAAYEKKEAPDKVFFSQKDVILITYGDLLKENRTPPLQALKRFADQYLAGTVTLIHLLPFFPFSSDDGFSVIDFMTVDPDLGSWDDVVAIEQHFGVMFDWVLNHISAQSPWFAKYLAGEKGFEQLAVEADPEADLSRVVRPRTSPLLTPFKKGNGERVHIWTTFSPDQIDLNYASIDVLIKMLAVLLHYVQKGAAILRLDAIAYLWKEIGTNCIHRPETHALVRLFRAVLDQAAPHVAILTETNVPHKENISYFGDGCNEAQMVYNFTLPPLLLYTFISEDATLLTRWAAGLKTDSEQTTFFNFTASHDGIGVRPLEGIVTDRQMTVLLERVEQNGGRVSYKNNPDGSRSPYELNITYLDALRKRSDSDQQHISRFLASQAIMLALPGVPGIYLHSLLGSRNWQTGVEETSRPRSINREKLRLEKVLAELETADSFRSRIFDAYTNLIRIRRRQPAFHPNAAAEVLDFGPGIFALTRYVSEQRIMALTNISCRPVTFSLAGQTSEPKAKDLITQKEIASAALELQPSQTVWLELQGKN